jgi:hypothetical protein
MTPWSQPLAARAVIHTEENNTMSSTHFGFKTVDEKEKAKHVRGVFDSVASKYDIMNDLMSAGLHLSLIHI